MKAYPTVRVGDVLRLDRRPVVVEIDREYEEIGVRSFGRGIFHKDSVEGGALNQKRVFRIEPGDLVISNVFAWEGAIAVASEAESGRIGSHRFMTFVPIAESIDTAWASWFFRSEPGIELIRRASPGSAGRNRTLAIKRFEALKIPLPPIAEQRRVANLLNQAQASSDTVARLTEQAGSMEAALQTALVSTEDTQGAQDWRTVQLGSVMQPVTELVPVDPTSSYRWTGIYSFGKGLIDRGLLAGADTSYTTLTVLREDQVVISKLNGWEGAVAVVSPAFAGSCVSAEFPTFQLDQAQLLPQFFEALAKAPRFWEALNQGARGSMVRRRRISPQEFLRAPVRLPVVDVQVEAVRQLALLKQAAAPRQRASKRAASLVAALLNREFDALAD